MKKCTSKGELRRRSPLPFPFGMNVRVARTHEAVMQAATALLLEGGPSAITMDGVVARSGVAKSTMYRHWATRDELVTDVFSHLAPKLEIPDRSLDFEASLRTLARSIAVMMADEHWRSMTPALLLLKHHQRGVAGVEERLHEEQSKVFSDVLQRGIDEGVLAPDEDIEMAITLVVGPLLMASLVDSVAITETLADRTVDQFLAAARSRLTTGASPALTAPTC